MLKFQVHSSQAMLLCCTVDNHLSVHRLTKTSICTD